MKDLFDRNTGELASAVDHWQGPFADPPRCVGYWHPQFAISAKHRVLFDGWKRGVNIDGPVGGALLGKDKIPEMNKQRSSIIQRTIGDAVVGHWRLDGKAMSLPFLFLKLGRGFTAYDLMRWYVHARKFVKTRDHSLGSQEHQEASHERLRHFGHWGYRNGM